MVVNHDNAAHLLRRHVAEMHRMQHPGVVDQHLHLGLRPLLPDSIEDSPGSVHRRQVNAYRQEIQIWILPGHIVPDGIRLVLEESHYDDIVALRGQNPDIFQTHTRGTAGDKGVFIVT